MILRIKSDPDDEFSLCITVNDEKSLVVKVPACYGVVSVVPVDTNTFEIVMEV